MGPQTPPLWLRRMEAGAGPVGERVRVGGVEQREPVQGVQAHEAVRVGVVVRLTEGCCCPGHGEGSRCGEVGER